MRKPRPVSPWLVWAAAFALAGCWFNDVTEPPRQGEPVTLLVRANVAAAIVSTLVVEVTAADITSPLVFNIPVTDGTAAGTITVSSGSDRTFTMRAFDAGGVQTHGGSRTMDVHPGTNPAITITLTPSAGDIPIDVTMGSVSITVVPSSDTLLATETVSVKARIMDGNGDPVEEPVTFATLDPDVATVQQTNDSTATVTAVAPGQTVIVAAFAGVGGSASILVSVPPAKQLFASGLASPTYVTGAPGDPTRVFVTERAGKIRVIHDGTLLATPFLDLTGLVSTANEQGLLSMAFHPNYATNGEFFIYYTNDPDGPTGGDGDTRVVRYTVSADPNVADGASGDTILALDQPGSAHNGGQVEFGPDGMLYISLGDGGAIGSEVNGQDNGTLLGSLLRVDIAGVASGYNIPPDNPFVGDPFAREEIWAYGLRNPWRLSFDPVTGDMYLSDVGQDSWEEVNIEPDGSIGGANYGWATMEGPSCYIPSTGCDQTGLTLPTFAYAHDTGGCSGSINGGYVYRNTDIPVLYGHYLYGDFCKGFVKSFRYSGGAVIEERDWTSRLGVGGFSMSSFGRDSAGRIYIVSMGTGEVFRIIPGN